MQLEELLLAHLGLIAVGLGGLELKRQSRLASRPRNIHVAVDAHVLPRPPARSDVLQFRVPVRLHTVAVQRVVLKPVQRLPDAIQGLLPNTTNDHVFPGSETERTPADRFGEFLPDFTERCHETAFEMGSLEDVFRHQGRMQRRLSLPLRHVERILAQHFVHDSVHGRRDGIDDFLPEMRFHVRSASGPCAAPKPPLANTGLAYIFVRIRNTVVSLGPLSRVRRYRFV